MTVQPTQRRGGAESLADVLERVLDKGIVIAGDIVVDVLDIELLSIKLRLFVPKPRPAGVCRPACAGVRDRRRSSYPDLWRQ